MHYEREDGSVSFNLKDNMSVRQQLAFRAKLSEAAEGGVFVRYWSAAPLVVSGWQCELIPDMAAFDLDGSSDPRQAEIVIWTGNTIADHISRMETPSKN